jgi:hypothetical protein
VWKPPKKQDTIDYRQYVTSSAMSFGAMHDFVFRGEEAVDKDLFTKRVEKYRKKYEKNNDGSPLELMFKKVFG